jgi:hypothetical protein
MKDELAKIRPILDTMGPLINQLDSEDDIEDCDLTDTFQSSDCLGLNPDSSKITSDIKTNNEDRDAQTTTKSSGIPIFHVNANKFPQVGARNKIHGLPTLVLFLKGIEVWRFEGVISGEDILTAISDELERIGEISGA